MQKSPLRVGDLVRVRRRRWRIVDVRGHDACQVLTLAGLDAPHLGARRRFLAPFDTVEPVRQSATLRLVPRRAWRRACRGVLAANTPPGALGSGRHARIDVLPHQLEPALAVVRGLGSRLLLADDVGLGKTIQAGLVLSELRARAAADRALILTPAGLRAQWADELARRFAIDATVIDAREIRRRLATLPVGVNPWSTTPVAVASIDYVKRPETLPAVRACRWDVLIVDEAHGVGGDSGRHEAVDALAAQSAYVLLLTATPHNGDPRAFSSLCGLGAHGDPILLFRRTRRDVRLGTGRRVHRLLVGPSAAELRMHALLARFTRAVCEEARAGGDERPGNDRIPWLALTVLHKRALSSARSLEQTIERRLATLASTDADHTRQLGLPLLNLDGEEDDADRPPELAGLALGDAAREQAMLRELAAAARQAAAAETKVAALVRFLDRIAEPAIVFTEYRDTLMHLRRAIARPAAVLHGGLGRDERRAALDDFLEGRCSILLATDAAGEGLNLHQTCRLVVNLELPWNPMRLEQRIGRVDRIGQRRTVHAVHLIARGTDEARILERLRARIAQAQAAVGAADPIGDDERAVARLVIDGSVGEDTPAPVRRAGGDEAAGERVIRVMLASEALAEAARLADAGRFTRRGDEEALARLEADGVWLTFARNRSTRAALGTRVLLILREGCEDESGRLVESRIWPLAIDRAPGRTRGCDRHDLAELVRAAMSAATAELDAAARSWRERAAALGRAFFEMRLARERAVADRLGRSSAAGFQPGLFDRRAEHQRLADRAAATEAADEAADRLAALERASRLVARPPQLLLVLAP